MTNREQIAFTVTETEYADSEVAEQLCEMISAIGGIGYSLKEPLTKWLGLECNPDTNNWGELDEKDRADYYEEEDE